MTESKRTESRAVSAPSWLVLLIAVTALAFATAALVVSFAWRGPDFGMMGGGYGMMGGGQAGTMGGGAGMMGGGAGMMGGGAGMMGGGAGMMGGRSSVTDPGPGATGFVAGTTASPRIVRVTAGPGFAFYPSEVAVVRGETITFVVTTMGPATHEFMVGPADAVANDVAGTPEIDGIGMMQTKSVTYTFDGPGPYAFACHETGHFEAGMRGSITLVAAGS